jgi:hypothetical protein
VVSLSPSLGARTTKRVVSKLAPTTPYLQLCIVQDSVLGLSIQKMPLVACG